MGTKEKWKELSSLVEQRRRVDVKRKVPREKKEGGKEIDQAQK